MTAFSRKEMAELLRGWGPGRVTPCPSCQTPLDVTRVDPQPGVSYVRWRAVVVCSGCGRSGAGDRLPPPSPSTGRG